MSGFLKNFFSSPNGEPQKHLVVECLGEAVKFVVCFAQEKERVLNISKESEFSQPAEKELLWGAILQRLQKIKEARDATLLLGGEIAKTVYTTTSVIREESEKRISEAELEDLLANALWKASNREKARAASFFEMSDIGVELVSARVMGVRLDGFRVISPVDFSAKTVEFEISLTFMPQFLAESFFETFLDTEFLAVEELSAFCAGAMAKIDKKDFYLGVVLPKNTMILEKIGQAIRFKDDLRWGGDDLKRVLETEFGVDEEVGEKILEIYAQEKLSASLNKKITKTLSEELYTLVQAGKNFSKQDSASRFYLILLKEISKKLESQTFKKSKDKHLPITVVNRQFLGERFGYKVQLSAKESEEEGLLFSLYLLHLMDLRPDPQMQKLIRRRIQWRR